MTDFLQTLGGLTLGGSIIIIVLALIAHISCTRYGARWRCWIWVLLCLRLALPLSIPAAEVLPHRSPIQIPIPSDTIIYQPPTPSGTFPSAEQDPTSSSSPNTAPSIFTPENPHISSSDARGTFSISTHNILFGIWLTGTAATLLNMAAAHIRFLRYLKRWCYPASDSQLISIYNHWGDQLKLDQRPSLLICPGLPAPMLAGLIRPVLLLPEDTSGFSAPGYAILHELTHYRRKDIWLKSLVLWVNALHWFNPLVWYMVRLVERDTELACDEDALRQLPPEEHSAYGHTILDAADRLQKTAAYK